MVDLNAKNEKNFNDNIRNENGEVVVDFGTRNEIRINNVFFKQKAQQKS